MLSNYFILFRISRELDSSLKDYKIISAFSQEKERVILECRKGEDVKYIEISVNRNFPWITLRDKYTRAKKNVFNVFPGAFPSVITGISIALFERIIKIKLESGALYFSIRGNRTNLFLISESQTETFLKTNGEEKEKSSSEFLSLEYITSPPQVNINDGFDLSAHPYIGRDIVNEAKYRDHETFNLALEHVINDILNKAPAVYWDESNLKLAADGFTMFRSFNKQVYETLITAVNAYITKKYSGEYFTKQKKSLLSVYEKEMEKLASRLNSLKARIDAGSKENEYKKLGELLLININSIGKGKDHVIVEDLYNNNEPLKIRIDPGLPARKNTDRYFEKARDEKLGYEKSLQLYEASLNKYEAVKRKVTELKKAEDSGDIRHMDIKKQNRDDKEDIKSKFRQYVIEGKYYLYVGRDSEKNDLLTMKFAKQNDYWFHARGVSGSHVVLRVDNAKEPVPRPVLKKAAAIAAFHSKAKTASVAPVSYTLKKYVTKKKGMEPGKVYLLREDVLLVKPEIPPGCEYISSE